MKQYQLQANHPNLGWYNISAVYDYRIPYMTDLEEAKSVLDEINKKFYPNTDSNLRIVSRKVTPWVVEK